MCRRQKEGASGGGERREKRLPGRGEGIGQILTVRGAASLVWPVVSIGGGESRGTGGSQIIYPAS